MNNRPSSGPSPADGQSPLSLLVNAADSRDAPRAQREGQALTGHSLADTLRLRGLAGDANAGHSLEEQLLLQQQQQQAHAGGAYGAPGPSGALLSHLRDPNFFSHLGAAGGVGQNHQLASLLGLSGAANLGQPADVRSALVAAQLRQAQSQHPQQFSPAELLALSRSGALPGSSPLLGSRGLAGAASAGVFGHTGAPGLASELESLQRLEEMERRQRLMATAASGPSVLAGAPPASSAAESHAAVAPPQVRGPIIRDERGQGHIPRPDMDTSTGSKAGTAEEGGKASESGNKDELEKTPGSVIVPCRARGMPMDHNFKTAYFVIPENVKHGEELICSYFACRNAGIKFRYCSHCKVPVAKRNFRKRHKHGADDGDRDDDSGDEEMGGKKGIPSHITAKRPPMEDLSNSGESNDKEDIQHGLVQSSMTCLVTRGPAQSHESIDAGDGKISAERRGRWASLLGRRPSTKDGESMSTWLMEVLAVSDLETPLKPKDAQLMPPGPKLDPARAMAQAAGLAIGSESAASAVAATSASEELKKAAAVATALSAGVVKKKRPAEALQGDASSTNTTTQPSENFASGSFAAWKERKKVKKQAKMNPTQEAEV